MAVHGHTVTPGSRLRMDVAAAAALLAGCVLAQRLPALPGTVQDAVLAALGMFVLVRWPRARCVALVLLAFAWSAWRGSEAMRQRLPRHLEGRDFDVVGVTEGLPRVRPDAVRMVLRIDRVHLDGVSFSLHGRLRLSWYDAPATARQPCMIWHLRVRLKRPRAYMDPGVFDAERYALAERVTAVGYVREDRAPLGRPRDGPCIDRLRERVSAHIGTVVGRRRARLLQALAVGDVRGLEPQDWSIARTDGVSHLLAISGFHIGVAAWFGMLLAGLLWRAAPTLGRRLPRPVAQAGAGLGAATAYALLAGFGLATQRALLMIAVVALARCSRRHVRPMQALALALAIMLVVDPLAVLAPGFWLSFAAVGLLLAWQPAGHGRGWRAHLASTGRAQVLMSLGLLPLGVAFFGQVAPLGALANLLAIPVVSLCIVPALLLGLALVPVAGPLSAACLRLAATCMAPLWHALRSMSALPGMHAYLPAPSSWSLLAAVLGALWLLLPRGLPGRWLGVALLLPLVLPRSPPTALGGFSATVLDVGQGLSVLVRTRDHALLFDTGPKFRSGFDVGAVVVVPSLHALGVRGLDRLIVSHGDADHAGGAPAVLAAYPGTPARGGEPSRTPVPIRQCHAGRHWRWDGVEFRMLHPDAAALRGAQGNDRSCVLLVRGRGGRLLLTGDISERVEGRVARRIGHGPPLVLLVPHHGSASSSSVVLLAAADPAWAVVSTGWRNRFGHPRRSVLARYARARVRVYDTAVEGAVSMRFPAAAPPRIVTRWRRRRSAYWRE